MAKIFLIPTPLSPVDFSPLLNREVIATLDYFVVENIRTVRRFLATLKLDRPIDEMEFAELSEHTPAAQVEQLLLPVLNDDRSCGVLSEAGLPCVADPGNLLVGAAHRHGVEVVPLVGGSSIMLALMASGAGGQNFAFNGYLPVKGADRLSAIRRIERLAQSGQTQIFIETPYRNLSLFSDLVNSCNRNTMLCVASDLTGDNMLITSRTIGWWLSHGPLGLGKVPAIFVLFM
ncbi:MAG: SAM-dependent methyltransferase [Mucinivorans sp.]